MKRFAFTMLELVFVIIVIGILAVLAMPSFTTNPLQQAAQQVASHIRYTQHLAIVDDVYDPAQAHWWYARPQISFRTCTNGDRYYYVGNDRNLDSPTNIDKNESSLDPLTKKYLYWNNDCDITMHSDQEAALLLTHTYNVSVSPATNCATISFDSFGRPYNSFSTTNSYSGLLTNACTILLNHSDGNATITVQPETGYVSVSYN